MLAVRESGAIKNFRKLETSSQDFPTLKNCHNCSLSVSENSSKKKSCKYTIDLDVGIVKCYRKILEQNLMNSWTCVKQSKFVQNIIVSPVAFNYSRSECEGDKLEEASSM